MGRIYGQMLRILEISDFNVHLVVEEPAFKSRHSGILPPVADRSGSRYIFDHHLLSLILRVKSIDTIEKGVVLFQYFNYVDCCLPYERVMANALIDQDLTICTYSILYTTHD